VSGIYKYGILHIGKCLELRKKQKDRENQIPWIVPYNLHSASISGQSQGMPGEDEKA
jgi:hypothetical protein